MPTSDYERYLELDRLLSCQTDDPCNQDELQFQVVHQAIELHLKLAGHTLEQIADALDRNQSETALQLFDRVRRGIDLVLEHFTLLDTMWPRDYQEIRTRLGQGSGQDSPGYRAIQESAGCAWTAFGRTADDLKQCYQSRDVTTLLCECFATLDQQLESFRFRHFQTVHRALGPGAISLKGNPVEALAARITCPLFPELWEARQP